MIRHWARAYGHAYRDLYDLAADLPVTGWLLSAAMVPASRASRAAAGLRDDIVWGAS